MISIQPLLEKFWDPAIWLPPNITWADLKSHDQVGYTNHNDLLLTLPLAILVLAIRYGFETFCFTPLGLALGIKGNKVKKAVDNEILEKAFKHVKTKHKDIAGLAKQLDWSERQVERWMRTRRQQERPSTLAKFAETGWRFTYYAYSFSFALYVLWDKPWLWNTDLCWENYPHQVVPVGVWWICMTTAAFYWSLMISQFCDVQRKDFWQMFAHHVFTLSLLSISWVCNFHRIGTLIILIHDFVDIFLELAKMLKYAKYQGLCHVVFAMFTIAWLTTRTGIFPFVIIYSSAIRAPVIANTPMFPAFYIFNVLLFSLLGLHIFWTYLILKVAKSALSAGAAGDVRSSSSDLSDTSDHSGMLSGDHFTPSPKKSLEDKE